MNNKFEKMCVFFDCLYDVFPILFVSGEIVHRNLKPSSVLLDTKGTDRSADHYFVVKLCNFSKARSLLFPFPLKDDKQSSHNWLLDSDIVLHLFVFFLLHRNIQIEFCFYVLSMHSLFTLF